MAHRWTAGVVAVACLAFLVQSGLGIWDKGATFDEVAHIAAAHDYISRGAYVLNLEHPPLVKQLAGLALLPLGLRGRVPEPPPPDVTDLGQHWRDEQWVCGRALLNELNGDRKATILRVARVPTLLMAVPFLAVVFLWGRAMLGTPAALTALALCTFDPTLLAFAPLVHTDFTLTVLFVAALAQTWRLRRGFTWPRAAGLGLICGLALCAKYSALLLGPIIAAIALAEIARLRGGPGLVSAAPSRGQFLLEWLAAGVVVTLVALLPVLLCTWRWDPGWWFRGLATLYRGITPNYLLYCAGRLSADGFWYYYLLGIALKIPEGAWGLIALGLGALPHLDRERRLDALIFALLPLAMFHGCAMSLPYNLGVRYVLPTFPLLFLVGGVGGAWLWGKGRPGRALLALLLGAHALASLWVAPDYLGHFNLLAGGPRSGHRWLDDSNVDWGQDLPALARWRAEIKRRDPGARLGVIYFGSDPPVKWGRELLDENLARFAVLLPDWDHLAISQHMWVRMRFQVEQVLGLPFRWDEALIHDWVRNAYMVFHLAEAADGSGDIIIDGAQPRRIARDRWLAEGRITVQALETRLARARAETLALMRWQSARFFERWGAEEDAAAAYERLDAVLRPALARARQAASATLSPELRADLIHHFTARGTPGRARIYER